MYKIDFHCDFETRSHLDLKVVGTVNYATHWSTQITRLTYACGRTGHLKIWRPLIEPVPSEIMEVALHPERYNFIAWNVFFDYLIWICVLSRMIPGLKRPPIENIHDAMALSCHFRTGASLESASIFMNMPVGKDPEGRRIMLKSCKPGRDGKFVALTPAEEIAFDRYALGDTRLLREIYYMLPPLPSPERYAWEWTFRRNLEGIRVDVALVNELNAIVDSAMPGLEKEFMSITGALINSHVKVREWFQQFWPEIKDMRSDTVRDMFKTIDRVPPHARRALEIKDLAGSTAIAKLKTANNIMYFGRIFDLLKYAFAQTKRWSGNGIQIQNFPRVDGKRPDSVEFEMNVKDLAEIVRALRPGLKDPVGFAKNLLRRIWLPTPGNVFYCGDWSKIEPTTLFWLLDMGPIPKKWYEEMASEIYNIPVEQIGKDSEERQVGKTADLSCGYGAGWESFQIKTYEDTGIWLSDDMAKLVVGAYRRKYPEVVQFWSDLQDGFGLAIGGQTSSLCQGKVHIMPMQAIYPNYRGVVIRLPSGSYLYYHRAEALFENSYEMLNPPNNRRVNITEALWKELPPIQQNLYKKQVKKVYRYLCDYGQGKVGWKYIYGGLLCENVVSATARDFIVPATYNMEQAGFNILGLVHDEMWADAAPGREEEFKRIMCINPSWCNMEITSDLKCGERYLK